MLRFYIALYGIGEPGSYHWALFAAPDGANIAGPVQVFQIITQKLGYPGEDGFMASHGVFSVIRSGNFICAIRLPSLNMSMSDLNEYMTSQYVGRRGSPLIPTPNEKWSCFQWAMRAVKGLISLNVVVPESTQSFFTQRAAVHPKWGSMMHVAGTVAAHDARTNRHLLDMSSGVPMMSLERSGICL